MKHNFPIRHEFVEFIPETLSAGLVYISIPYATAAHSCFCGCGNKVVTPLSRQGWSVTFDGESVSLYPSIGNYGLPCQSHYFVRNNRVEWARVRSHEEIVADRRRDGLLPSEDRRDRADESHSSLGRRLVDWFFGR
jgi:Family of unknown function (DUF6527)